MDLFIPALYLFFLCFSLSHLSHKDVFTEFTGIQDVKKKMEWIKRKMGISFNYRYLDISIENLLFFNPILPILVDWCL